MIDVILEHIESEWTLGIRGVKIDNVTYALLWDSRKHILHIRTMWIDKANTISSQNIFNDKVFQKY